MKLTLLILGVLFVAAFTAQSGDILDTLSHRFLFKSDLSRRIYVASLSNDNRVFQLAYGLKRRKMYDEIRQYIHPNVQQLVLYGTSSFYIMVGKTYRDSLMDDFYDYFLSSLRYEDQDRRDDKSTYVNVHTAGWQNKRWKLTPKSTVYGGISFIVSLATDENTKYDHVNQKGWQLTAQRLLQFDMRSDQSSNIFSRKAGEDSNTWLLYPINGGDSFLFALSRDDNKFDHVDQTGWFMDIGDERTTGQNPDDFSNYVIISEFEPMYSWNIRFAG